MDFIAIAIGLAEVVLTVAMAVSVVWVTLRALIKTNTDFDEDREILKGNVAVGILVAALLLAASNIMHAAFKPVVETVHLWLTSPLIAGLERTTPFWKLMLFAVGNLVLAYLIVIATLSVSLRLFGKLARTKKTRPGIELEKGNLAIGVILSSYVLIISMFVGDGVRALSKALVPKPSIGHMRQMR